MTVITVLRVLSVPCKPTNIKAVMDCYTLMALVEWYPSDGALSYIVMATTASGHNVTCKANTTYCSLEGLLCGKSYSVSVKAVGQTCSSIAYWTGQLVTGEQHTGLTKLHARLKSPSTQ